MRRKSVSFETMASDVCPGVFPERSILGIVGERFAVRERQRWSEADAAGQILVE